MLSKARHTSPSLHLVIAFLTLTASAWSVKAQPRHDGKGHHAAHNAAEARRHARGVDEVPDLAPRQDSPVSLMQDPPISSPSVAPPGIGPVDGIIAPPLPPLPSPSQPTFGPYSSPSIHSDPILPTTVPPSNTIPSTALPTSISDGFPNPFPSATSYYFPSTTIQIPIATVCPDTPHLSAIFPFVPLPSLSLNVTIPLPPRFSTTHITALLPNGSSTMFLTTTRLPTPNPTFSPFQLNATISNPSSNNPLQFPSGALALSPQERILTNANDHIPARILLDGDGCQTLYSPITTALCRTTVRLIGIPDATVTDCDQWVTFSSENVMDATSTATAAATRARAGVVAARATNSPPPPTLVARDAALHRAERTPGPTLSATTPMISDGYPGTYYEAHWYDIVHGGVPRDVRVEKCTSVEGPYVGPWVTCLPHSEIWSVATVTKTTSFISVASYSGPAVLTAGSLSVSTTVVFKTTLTLPTVVMAQSVVKRTLGGDVMMQTGAGGGGGGGGQQQGTVTVQATVPYTMELQELTRTSEVWVTETRTTVGVEVVTRTVGS